MSLNDVLKSGPDLANNLLGILVFTRMMDIQKMFYGFRVPEMHSNISRFMCYADNDLTKPLIEYRMCVHVFGNSSSRTVATYGLRKIAQVEEPRFGTDMKGISTF